MASQAPLDIFERAVTARGRLLRVEADPARPHPRLLALTFDIGRIALRPEDGEIRAEAIPDRALLPPGLVPLDEEDPWWRLLGHPITAVWPVADDAPGAVERTPALRAIKLRFRESDANPRIVAVTAAGAALRITLEGS